ncbi:MAG: trimethylamine methyltransferase family protein, partial [Hyphomicrobiaceae bacterium]
MPKHSPEPAQSGRSRRRGREQRQSDTQPARDTNYAQLQNPFTPQKAFSDDHTAAIHDAALRVLEELGIRVLHDGARKWLQDAGAEVDDDTRLVKLDRGLIAQSLDAAPSQFVLQAGVPERHVTMGGDSIAFVSVGGAPNFSDLDGGKRTGTLEDTRNIIRLAEMFDVMHLQSPNVESQDVPLNVRHLQVTHSQLTLSNKTPFIYSRGAPQVRDCFEMMRLARGLDEDAFRAKPYCYTVINTNSPRQLDIPMCQGIIDFATAGQALVITPFTLSGAMAPVTVAGALTLQHAEALAGIALAQIVRPGTPVVYGSFTSNVDMKSGAPAFGTPEYIKAALGGGQLARHIGLPWRGSSPTASNAPDVQGSYETLMSLWASLLGGVNMVLHAAGWLEGGLTASMEKFILDVEGLQILAEAFQPLEMTDADIGFDAIA